MLALCVILAAQPVADRSTEPSAGQIQAPRAASEPGWAPARPTRHLVEAGMMLGGFFPASDPELYDSTQLPPTGLGSAGPLLGLRLAYFPWAFVGAEAEGGGSVLDPDVDGSAVAYHVRTHLVLQVPGRWTPFAVVGGGLLGVGGEVGDDVDRAAHWGLGLKHYVNDRWSVRLDGRHLISARQGPDAGNTNHFEASLGLGFALYRAPPPRSAPVRTAPPPPEPQPLPEPEPEPAPVPTAPAPSPIAVEAAQNIENLLNDVQFGFDSADIAPGMRPLLDRILEGLLRQQSLRITIEGHACDLGSEAYNQVLSRRRAEAVRDYLVQRGIAPDRIQVRAAGEAAPRVPNDSPENRQRNRRTEFSVQAAAPEPAL